MKQTWGRGARSRAQGQGSHPGAAAGSVPPPQVKWQGSNPVGFQGWSCPARITTEPGARTPVRSETHPTPWVTSPLFLLQSATSGLSTAALGCSFPSIWHEHTHSENNAGHISSPTQGVYAGKNNFCISNARNFLWMRGISSRKVGLTRYSACIIADKHRVQNILFNKKHERDLLWWAIWSNAAQTALFSSNEISQVPSPHSRYLCIFLKGQRKIKAHNESLNFQMSHLAFSKACVKILLIYKQYPV